MKVFRRRWVLCSMFSPRVTKCLMMLSLFLCLFSYGQYHSNKQTSLIQLRVKPTCANGDTKELSCDVIKKNFTTKQNKVKPTKKENKKKLEKAPNLDSVHILPNTVPMQVQDFKSIKSEKLPKKTTTFAKKVLILSYFKSGSLELGDILGNHPDIFYFNEPLYPFDSTAQKDGEEPISRRYISEATEYLTDLFECKIVDSKLGYSEDMVKKIAKKAYTLCQQQQHSNVSECVQQLCLSKPVILSKTIRVYIQDVHSFLMKNRGSARVIILQQDPRVNLHLRNRKSHPGWTTGSDMFFQGRSLCARMLHDAQNAKRLEGSGHKDFYRIVLYEHFLKNPENILRGILSYIGMNSDLEDVKMLLRSANVYKHIRKVNLNKWEWIPDDEAGLNIDKACSFFYRYSLYNPMVQRAGLVQRYNLCQYCD
ncbi:Carbohydrate sulfotransferase 5 like protein [Argiope bruennichi]|uniref:Carbohydrate sulfotransferase 5 like protein n=1 Tax=Argiope bruennichi TaxID=94029 RepID=A0A8T0E1E4_ARGBR|nr:Carbohydrate sulfotransferase 5 like protein [Argiope bruennichi]